MPRLSIVEVAPFAAISSLAVRASDGSSAMRAGRNSVEQTPTADAAAKTMMRSSSSAPAAETSESGRAQEHDSEQEPLAPEAIAERRRERRDRGRREQAHEAGDPDRRRSAVVVREHAERDEVRPLGRDRRAPGQLGAANVRVLGRDAEGGERLAETGHEESQADGGRAAGR